MSKVDEINEYVQNDEVCWDPKALAAVTHLLKVVEAQDLALLAAEQFVQTAVAGSMMALKSFWACSDSAKKVRDE